MVKAGVSCDHKVVSIYYGYKIRQQNFNHMFYQ